MARTIPLGISSSGNDYMLSFASGDIPKASSILKFGENTEIGADTEEDIWSGGGIYNFPSTSDITHISQSVDQVAMRGGTIEIQGLDDNFELVVQEVDLDATLTTNPVALTTPLMRLFRMRVLENVVSNQTITAHNSGNTITYGIIDGNYNQTLMALYTIPANKTGYIVSYYATMIQTLVREPKSVAIKLWTKDNVNNYAKQIKHIQGLPLGASVKHKFTPYFKVTEKTDIILSGYAHDNIAHINAGFNIILLDN